MTGLDIYKAIKESQDIVAGLQSSIDTLKKDNHNYSVQVLKENLKVETLMLEQLQHIDYARVIKLTIEGNKFIQVYSDGL